MVANDCGQRKQKIKRLFWTQSGVVLAGRAGRDQATKCNACHGLPPARDKLGRSSRDARTGRRPGDFWEMPYIGM